MDHGIYSLSQAGMLHSARKQGLHRPMTARLWQSACAGSCPAPITFVHKTHNQPSSPRCVLQGDFLPHYFRAIALPIKMAIGGR
jgi:hypothetical protein